MKKLICIVLAIACMCSLFACGGKVGKFADAIENTEITKAKVTTTVTGSLGELTGSFDITYAEDGSAKIKYTYEQWNSISASAENSADMKTTVSGEVTRLADGTYSDGAAITGTANEAASEVLLNVGEISNDFVTSESEDGNTITATVPAASTEAVFGTAYAYDVTVTLVKGDAGMEKISVSYTVGTDSVVIECLYN